MPNCSPTSSPEPYMKFSQYVERRKERKEGKKELTVLFYSIFKYSFFFFFLSLHLHPFSQTSPRPAAFSLSILRIECYLESMIRLAAHIVQLRKPKAVAVCCFQLQRRERIWLELMPPIPIQWWAFFFFSSHRLMWWLCASQVGVCFCQISQFTKDRICRCYFSIREELC